jgi:hypothetical protein
MEQAGIMKKESILPSDSGMKIQVIPLQTWTARSQAADIEEECNFSRC